LVYPNKNSMKIKYYKLNKGEHTTKRWNNR
jgi:hypothetical protein